MAGQGSARVTLKEIDLSQVRDPEQSPLGVPAAVVGPAKRGPAFVPKTFATIQQFSEAFGNMLEVNKTSNANLFGPLALNEWMKNSESGTFMRVLGVGNGLKSTLNQVTDAGFKLGKRISHDDSGNLRNNPNIYNVAKGGLAAPTDTGLLNASRTYMLGANMIDAVSTRYLTAAGSQIEDTAASKAITFGTSDPGDVITIFLPKQLINDKATTAVSKDITLTIKFVTKGAAGAEGSNLTAFTDVSGRQTAAIADDTIEMIADGNAATALNIVTLLSQDIATGNSSHDYDGGNDANDVFRFNKLSINLSEHFASSGTTEVRTITLKSNKKEGDEVKFTQTAPANSTDVLSVNSVLLTGASKKVPVIRGVLMTPQGVVPACQVTVAENFYTVFAPESLGAVAAGDNLLKFGDSQADGTENLNGYEVGKVTNDKTFDLVLNGFKSTTEPASLLCSLDPESSNYFANVLNTDPTKIEEKGHYLYAHWDIDTTTAVSGVSWETGVDGYRNVFCLPAKVGVDIPNFDSFESRFRHAESPWITSQLFGKGSTVDRGTTLSGSGAYKLFKLHALDAGVAGNTRFRVLLSNVRSSGTSKYGSFDLSLESFDSDPIKGSILVSWKSLNLDPDSRNYIARVIGDKHIFYNFDKDLDKQRLEETGDFDIRNSYVRVEMHDLVKQADIPVNALPVSVGGLKSLNTKYSGTGSRLFDESGDDAGVNKLLTTNFFDNLVVSPIHFVKSVARKSGSSFVADSSLPWGVKFAKKRHSDDSNKELSQLVLNKSIESWTKYFPDLGAVKAVLEGDEADSFQNGYFSLEKIAIKVVANAIDWSSALYCRDGKLPKDYTRFLDTATDATGQNIQYFKFRTIMQGGFDGVNIFDKEKSELTSIAAHREANNETTITGINTFTGPTVESYKRAIDVLSDKSATEFQLLAIPGIREPLVTDYAIAACETRFDAMLIMDIEEASATGSTSVILDSSTRPHVRNTISRFTTRSLDTSFAAAYFPDVIMRRPSNKTPLRVPPSVSMLGVMSQNDTIADPWFAPAGLNRGKLSAIKSQVQMNRTLLDELYDADINPIYEPAGRSGEVYAFGQKTLLQDQSALDRINVRRLLINIRRRVKNIAQTLLFEPNRESTLAKFSALVEPVMAEVQARQGVDRYKVQIDTTTTTQNDVENNTIRGKIYLQPTKSVEFISLDFVVTNSID